MKKLIIPILMMFLLIGSVMADYVAFEGNDLVTVEVQNTLWDKFLNLFQEQSIYASKSTAKIGDKVSITINREVCADFLQLSSGGLTIGGSSATTIQDIVDERNIKQTIYITYPNGKIEKKSFPNEDLSLFACQSTYQPYTLSIYPSQEGKYSVHYNIIQTPYPQKLQQESVSFTVVKDSPECDKSELTSWVKYYTINNGDVYQRQKYYYDDDCEIIISSTKDYYKTECDSGYVVKGTNSRISDKQSKCEKATTTIIDEDTEQADQEEIEGFDEPEEEVETETETEITEEDCDAVNMDFKDGECVEREMIGLANPCEEGTFYDDNTGLCLELQSCELTETDCTKVNAVFNEEECKCEEGSTNPLTEDDNKYVVWGIVALVGILIIYLSKNNKQVKTNGKR